MMIFLSDILLDIDGEPLDQGFRCALICRTISYPYPSGYRTIWNKAWSKGAIPGLAMRSIAAAAIAGAVASLLSQLPSSDTITR